MFLRKYTANKLASLFVTVSILAVLAGLAGAETATKGKVDPTGDTWIKVELDSYKNNDSINKKNESLWVQKDSSTGQYYVNLTALQQYKQGEFVIADLNERTVLEFILDQFSEEPNEPGEEKRFGGGGGRGGSTNSLFASNGDAGFGGGHSLMLTGASGQYESSPVVLTDTYYAGPAWPIDNDTPQTVEPTEVDTTEGTAPVPEPATICLLGLGGTVLIRRRTT